MFISLLGYHLVHSLRYPLKVQGIHDSWTSIRRRLESRQRVTVTLQREDKRALHIRKTTRIEPHQQPILDALRLDYQAHTSKIMLV